jgi:hypothetical protein
VTIAAPTSAARRPTVSAPSAYVAGTSSTPQTSEGRRTQIVGSPSLAAAQASTKKPCGVTSGPL